MVVSEVCALGRVYIVCLMFQLLILLAFMFVHTVGVQAGEAMLHERRLLY
jgi:hypothetical protein